MEIINKECLDVIYVPSICETDALMPPHTCYVLDGSCTRNCGCVADVWCPNECQINSGS